MDALRKPRRIVIAALIFVVLSGGGLVGVAFAADTAEPQQPPFVFAEPAQGDRGVYHVTSDASQWEFGRIARGDGSFSFDMRQRIGTVDNSGTPRMLDEIAYRDDRYDVGDAWGAPVDTGILVDATTSVPVAAVEEWNHEEEDDPDSAGRARTVYYFDGQYGGHLVCGLHSPLQGRVLMPGDRVAATSCSGHLQAADMEAWFQVDEVGADALAAKVSLWTGPPWEKKVADLNFTAGVPYPVHVRVYSHSDAVGDFRLTAFDAGDQPMGSPALPGPVRLTLAPRTAWMFDEVGIDHPFSLSEAVTYARDDPASGLGTWLDDHPEAYIVDASYWDYERSSGNSIEWRIAFRDEQELFHVHIGKRQTVPDNGPLQPVHDLLADLGVQDAADPIYYFDASKRTIEDYGLWHPAPAQLPTVASMWAFYDTWASPALREAGPNMYEITILGGEEENRVIIHAGRFRDYPDGSAPDSTYSREWAFLEFELQQSPQPFRFSDRGFERPDAGRAPAQEFSTQATTRVEAAPFIPFTAAQAAAVGALAAMVALAYYLMPLAKTGGLALFSRIQKDDALRHPTRQALLDHIAAQPGISREALFRATELTRGTGQHHLAKLADTGHVVAVRSGGYTCYFVRGATDASSMHAQGFLKSPVARSILEHCATEPGITTAKLAQHIGVSPATTSYHTKRLRDNGMLDAGARGHVATQQGRAVRP